MLQQLRQRLVQLDLQIVEQRRVLDQLLQTRLAVEHQLATATYPVLTLPTEVTAEIFAHCFVVFDPPAIPKCTGSAPIVLTRVCRAWRDIALGTPLLWSQLRVRFDQIASSRRLNDLAEDLIASWLSHAGNYPLSLDFFSGDESFQRLRDTIHRYSHRVQRLCLNMGRRCDIRLLGLESASFPLLQAATLQFSNDWDPNIQHPAILFVDAPVFRDIHLPGFAGLNVNKLALPWLQLTKFHGTLPDLTLFTLAPNLAEIICTFQADEDILMVTTHVNLSSLTVGQDSAHLLRSLTLPALRCLDATHIEVYDYGHDLIESFLRRSSPSLVSLSFTGFHLEYWAQCIPLVAGTLETLEFADVSDEDLLSVLDFLNTSLLHSLPNVKTISFKTLSPSNLTALVCFLYARADKIRTFRAVWASDPFLERMTWAGPPGANYFDTISDHFARLGQAGMEIHLQTANIPRRVRKSAALRSRIFSMA